MGTNCSSRTTTRELFEPSVTTSFTAPPQLQTDRARPQRMHDNHIYLLAALMSVGRGGVGLAATCAGWQPLRIYRMSAEFGVATNAMLARRVEFFAASRCLLLAHQATNKNESDQVDARRRCLSF